MLEAVDYIKFHSVSRLEKSLNTLKGILSGISLDGKINSNEMEELVYWCSLQAEFADKHPYTELLPLIQEALADGKLSEDECGDILWVCNNFICENQYFDYITASIQQFHGIAHGILADNNLDDVEIQRLKDWVELNDFLSGTYPYDEIKSLLTCIFSDHRIDDFERLQLKSFLGEFVDMKNSYHVNLAELDQIRSTMKLTGVCAMCPDIVFEDHCFCFTGTSSRCKRDDIAKIVIEHNGTFSDRVTKATNYLVVGNGGNQCWAFSCYGRKVEQAVSMRKTGIPVMIIHENDFWDAL